MVNFNRDCSYFLRTFISPVITGILFLMASASAAAIINVPGDYPTIQEGIDASSNYDTVLVAPGHYIENVNFSGKEIVLTSHFMFEQNTDYIFSTIIDGKNQAHPDTGSTVLLVNSEGPAARLQGFTITGGTGTIFEWTAGSYDRNGGGIFMNGSYATVQYNYIYGNEAVDDDGLYSAGGGGIRVEYGGPLILNNVIVHNEGHYGAGIALGYCTVTIKNNVIAYNTGGAKYAGSGIQINRGGPTLIENNTIVGNTAPIQGVAIRVFSANPIVRNNIIWFNEGPEPHIYGYSGPTYCNIEDGYFPGTGNIDVEPHLIMNDWLFPYDDSPDIDSGDPGTAYLDIENPNLADSAKWPAFGGLRNDMGAYGGPGALPFKSVAAYSNTNVGEVPLSVAFDAYSGQEVSEWNWDFTDGGSAIIRRPMHLFDTPGQHDVILKAVTVSEDTLTGTLPIYVLADTVKTNDIEVSVSGSSEIEIVVNLTNNVPVREIFLPVEYSGSLDLEFASYHTIGCRTESYSGIELTADAPSKRLIFNIKSHPESPEFLPAGDGPVLIIVFNLVDWIVGTTTISFDGFDTTNPRLTGDGFEYMPKVVNGVVAVTYKCGDANGDDGVNIGDVVYIGNHVFRNGECATNPPIGCPPDPYEAGDVNCDGSVNIGDGVYLGNVVFRPGSPAPCASCQ